MSPAISSQLSSLLNGEFIQNVLTVSENDKSIRVHSVTGNIATSTGDNYMSDIFRVYVEFTRDKFGRKVKEKKSLIVKVAPNKESFNGRLGTEVGTFETEIDMFRDTLIKMNEALNENNVRFNANCIYAKIGDPSFIVLEDLRDLGFRLVERKLRLDFRHSKLLVQRLAKYHASSVAVYEKDPNVARHYSRGIYYKEGPENLRQLSRGSIKSLAIEISKWPELDPCYSEKLHKMSEVCYEKTIEYVTPKEGDLNVLCHGDCWINNMLFRYNDEGEVIDHIFVDFQVPVWSSPATDLLFFLNTSINDEVFNNHYDELLDEYLDVLTSTMARIGCSTKPPTPESFRKSLRERQFLAVLSSILSLPFVVVDDEEVIELGKLMNPESGQIFGSCKGRRFREKVTGLLREWNSRGLLDL